MSYPLGDPQGTARQRLWWKLGFRLVPTREERIIGAAMMVLGVLQVAAALIIIL